MWFAGALLFVFCARFISENTLWEFVEDAGSQGASLLARMLPPRWDYTPALLQPLWDTLNIATLGTNARNQQWHIANDRPNLGDLIWEGRTNHKADLARGIPLLCSKLSDVKIKRLALR